jgi:hypothetical protein
MQNIEHDIFLYEVAIDCVNSNLREYEHLTYSNTSHIPRESRKEINTKIRTIMNINDVIKSKFFDILDNRTIKSYRPDEIKEILDYCKENMISLLDKNQKATFEKYIDKVGYYDGVKEKYSSNKELRLMITKKYFTSMLTTYLLYN